MIEENLLSPAKSIERLDIQVKKTTVVEICRRNGGVEESSSKGPIIESIIEGRGATLKGNQDQREDEQV